MARSAVGRTVEGMRALRYPNQHLPWRPAATSSARRAYTVTELAVVIFVLAVLGSIAYGVFGGASAKQRSGSATAVLANVIVAQQQLYSDYSSYTSFGQDLLMAGAGVDLLAQAPSTSGDEVSMAVGSAGSLGLAVRVSADECRVVRVAPLSSGGAQAAVPVDSAELCRAELAFAGTEVAVEQVAPVRTGS